MDPRLGANAPLGPWSADGVGSTLEPYEVSTDNPVYARGDHRRGGHCLHRAFCGRGLDGDPHWRLVCCAHRAESAQPQEFARPQSGHSAQSIVFVPGHLPVERYQPQRADAAGGTTPLGDHSRACNYVFAPPLRESMRRRSGAEQPTRWRTTVCEPATIFWCTRQATSRRVDTMRSHLEQLVRLGDAGEEVASPMRVRIEPRPDELDRGPDGTHPLKAASSSGCPSIRRE